MKIIVLMLVLFCTSCASNSIKENTDVPSNLNERQVQCINEIQVEKHSPEEYKNEREMCIKYHSPNTLGAVIQGAISVALFIGIII